MKAVADYASGEALINTLLAKAKTHDAPIMNICIEFESTKTAHFHRKEIMANVAGLALPDGDLSLEQNDKDTKPTNSNPDRDPRSALHCANCDKFGHVVKDCIMPSPDYGSIRACGICNAKDHFLDNCPKLKAKDISEPHILVQLSLLIFTARANKPQL
jgi:hypothetical protein